MHSPLAIRQNLPSLAPSGPKFNGIVFTAAPVSNFIFTHSNRFGLLMASRSKLPSESELAALSQVSSQPSCHPTQLSSHHSIHQNSSHHQTKNCPSKGGQCDTNVQIPELLKVSLISGFRTDETSFRGFTIVRTLGTFGTLGFPFGLALTLLSLAFAISLGP